MELSLPLLVGIFVVLSSIYWFLTKNYNYWKNQNVPSLPDPIPFFGHMLPVITTRESRDDFAHQAYKSTSASVIGFYFMRKPGLILRDPELVKSVLQTNFSSFRANLVNLSEKNDPVLAKNPFFTYDMDLWKERRTQITNNLSGRKLKLLLAIVQEVSNKLSNFVTRKIESGDGFYECELKTLFARSTSEVVANAAFGIEGQNFEDKPDRLSFAKVAETIFTPSLMNGMKQVVISFLPELAEILHLKFLSDHTDKYFRQNIMTIIKERKQKNSSPNDFLQFVLYSKIGEDLDAVIADVIIFYGDVYVTSSTVLAHLFYYLSINEEVQTKLREHLTSKLDNKIVTYDSLKEMTYLDQVINESMRMSAPVGVSMKVCTEEITLTGTDGLKSHLKPGHTVFIPIKSLHLDENYWPDPEKFDPERFSSENQVNNTKFAFLPFGEGPRMCIGMRLGLLIVKTVTANLLTKYSVEHSAKTILPLTIDPNAIVTQYKGGVWAKFRKLSSIS